MEGTFAEWFCVMADAAAWNHLSSFLIIQWWHNAQTDGAIWAQISESEKMGLVGPFRETTSLEDKAISIKSWSSPLKFFLAVGGAVSWLWMCAVLRGLPQPFTLMCAHREAFSDVHKWPSHSYTMKSTDSGALGHLPWSTGLTQRRSPSCPAVGRAFLFPMEYTATLAELYTSKPPSVKFSTSLFTLYLSHLVRLGTKDLRPHREGPCTLATIYEQDSDEGDHNIKISRFF